MRKFVIGVLAGYLLTSIFSIPALPMGFWYFASVFAVCGLFLAAAWFRFNNDLHDGEF